MTKLTSNDYTVGWVYAIGCELNAAKLMLDSVHASLPTEQNDDNIYTLGQIGGHNVVITGPSEYGNTTTANAVTNMGRTFRRLRFVLMVGVGGGAPGPPNSDPDEDIRLGDVVVSYPKDGKSGVVQYDMGKLGKDGIFKIMSTLDSPPKILLNAAKELQSQHDLNYGHMREYINYGLGRNIRGLVYPELNKDLLFPADYEHPDGETGDCFSTCDQTFAARRRQRQSPWPVVHKGLIATANSVLKWAKRRDQLRHDMGVLCFEMEAAGVLRSLKGLIIRGISDYSDSHKNKIWQPYAALVAAAYAKDLLSVIPQQAVEQEKPVNPDPVQPNPNPSNPGTSPQLSGVQPPCPGGSRPALQPGPGQGQNSHVPSGGEVLQNWTMFRAHFTMQRPVGSGYPPPYTFTMAHLFPTVLEVVDSWFDTCYWEVYVDGKLVGGTHKRDGFRNNAIAAGTGPDAVNKGFSHGYFPVPEGRHTIHLQWADGPLTYPNGVFFTVGQGHYRVHRAV